MNGAYMSLAVLALPIAMVACAAAREDKASDPTVDAKSPPYLIPAEARREPAEYVDTLATGEAEDGALLIAGKREFRTRLFGEKLLRAPVMGHECLFYWLEVAYETEEADYHLLTDVSKNEIYVYVGDAYVKVDRARRAEEWTPDVVRTYKAGQEPADLELPAHGYPEVTYRLWLLQPGRDYSVYVHKYGSAYESAEAPGEIVYERYYHFFFR